MDDDEGSRLKEEQQPGTPAVLAASTGLLTDHYEFTMLDAALADGSASRPVAFEAFARDLPDGSGFGVMGGTARLVEAIGDFRFGERELHHLAEIVSPPTLEWLAGYRFGGTITAYPEGELWWPESPLLTVRGTFGECVLLETLVLSILNHGCAIATRAARITGAAGGTAVIEMGSRRCHEAAAVEAARLAWVAGFAATSNVEAGHRYRVPTSGTAAHAWTMVHDDELDAFRAQVATLGAGTTLLVDTYDIAGGIERAVTAAREAGADGPGAIRIDSGDLGAEATKARRQLDALGAGSAKVTVSGDLDVAAIEALVASGAPIDGFGVGTQLVAAPPVGVIYKLVAVGSGTGDDALRAVAKRSAHKASAGGVKRAWRVSGSGSDVVLGADHPGPLGSREVAVTVIDRGRPAADLLDPAAATVAARRRFQASLAELTGARS